MTDTKDDHGFVEGDTLVKNENQALTPRARGAIQGIEDAPSQIYERPIPMDIKASEFQPETQQVLRENGLDNGDVVLADHRGKNAEAVVATIFGFEGLPEGNLERTKLKNIVPGHYNSQRHGIDLIGVTADGKPIPIECKKRQRPKKDSLGDDSISDDRLEPESLMLRDEILREREINPAMRLTSENLGQTTPDSELSLDQMGGLWTRDRWLKLVKDGDNYERLRQAGVSEEYLSIDNLGRPYSEQWRDILDRRIVVIVTTEKENVSNLLYSQALFERGCNVAVLNLKS